MYTRQNSAQESNQKMTEQLTMGLIVDRVATIGRQPKTMTELSDSACTPKWLCAMLHEVDTDPCSNPRSHVKARRSFSLEKGLDGLKLPWWRGREWWEHDGKPESGSVYENFTYSNPMPWCEKTIEEIRSGNCHEVIVLCKLDPSTRWWKLLTGWDPSGPDTDPLGLPPDMWTFDERIQFDEHPDLIAMRLEAMIAKWEKKGKKGKKPTDGTSSNNFCSAIIHHRGFPRVDGQIVDGRVPRLKLSFVATLWEKVIE